VSSQNQIRKSEAPVILDGLPKIKPSPFTFSSIGQKINIQGSSTQSSSSIGTQGTLSAVGTIFDGSWFLETNQSNFTDSRTWQLSELQYLRHTKYDDLVIGKQPTFWQSQGSGDYFGLTIVKRLGFNSKKQSSGGFNPSQSLQEEEVRRTVLGKAEPGTLARLTQGVQDSVIAEILVNSSGIYRFENLPISSSNAGGYKVLLYPKGQLTAQPKIEEVKFLNLTGQLTKGTSALIFSAGTNREYTNNFLGNFNNLSLGIGYHLGVTEDLTLRAGLIYDQSFLQSAELFYQPANVPLQVRVSSLLGQKHKSINYNADITYQPFNSLSLNFSSDILSQRFQINSIILPELSMRLSGDSLENTLAGGLSLSKSIRDFYSFISADIDTKNNLRWNLNSSWKNLKFSHRANEISTTSELAYNFSGFGPSNSHLFGLSYSINNSNNRQDELLKFNWEYKSQAQTKDFRPLWQFNIGYGIDSRGSSLILSASTGTIPGLILRGIYEKASLSGDSSSFRIEISPSISVRPSFGLGDPRFDNLRNIGGIFIQPFLDRNNNGKLDKNEDIYRQDLDILLKLNNQSIMSNSASLPDINTNGIFIKVPPGDYRLDLDSAGYPLNYKPVSDAYAINVAAGGYTPVLIPFIPSYTVAGKVTNQKGEALVGARVEAINRKTSKVFFSITNGSGIFYLQELAQGQYDFKIYGKPAQPSILEITPNSQSLIEINLQLNLDPPIDKK
jgi:hypothetical protein